MTLRSCGRDTVPMMGPRSRASAAPQWMGNACFPPGSGWDVRRMWSVRFERFMSVSQKANGPPDRRAGLTDFGCDAGRSREADLTYSKSGRVFPWQVGLAAVPKGPFPPARAGLG